MSAELNGQKIGPFEQGYAAFLKGVPVGQNPFDRDQPTPYYKQQWNAGWDKAQREAWRRK